MGRATMFFTTLTGTLLALGFLAGTTDRVAPVAYAAVPVVAILGLLSFLRLVDIGVTDVVALQAIQRIRAYYATLTPEAPSFFPAPGPRQEIDAFLDTGATRAPWRSGLTVAATVGVVGVLLIAADVAFAAVERGAAVAIGATCGVIVAVAIESLLLRYQFRRFVIVVAHADAST